MQEKFPPAHGDVKVFSDDGDACRGDACLGDEAVGGVEADDAGSKHDDVGHGAA